MAGRTTITLYSSTPEMPVAKGGKTTFNIDAHLAELVKLANVDITQLTQAESQVLVGFNSTMMLAYDTPEYPELFKQARKAFNSKSSYAPGTVGAFVRGCKKGNSCQMECAGNLPPPKGSKYEFCKSGVYHSSRTFKRVKQAAVGNEQAIIYMFKGRAQLAAHEVKFLKDDGIKKVAVVHASEKVDVEKLKYTDIDKLEVKPDPAHDDDHSHMWFLVLLLILILIIVGVVIYRARR